jgi:hypothetical protein
MQSGAGTLMIMGFWLLEQPKPHDHERGGGYFTRVVTLSGQYAVLGERYGPQGSSAPAAPPAEAD